jgi:hypothetical protein
LIIGIHPDTKKCGRVESKQGCGSGSASMGKKIKKYKYFLVKIIYFYNGKV